MGIFDKFRKKKTEDQEIEGEIKKGETKKPKLVIYTEKDAMAKKDLKEALQALEELYKSPGCDVGGNPRYTAGKVDACYALQEYFKGDKYHTLEDLEHLRDYDGTRAGDPFNWGRWEVLNWAISRIHKEKFREKEKGRT